VKTTAVLETNKIFRHGRRSLHGFWVDVGSSSPTLPRKGRGRMGHPQVWRIGCFPLWNSAAMQGWRARTRRGVDVGSSAPTLPRKGRGRMGHPQVRRIGCCPPLNPAAYECRSGCR
jgi:hypothetical protein